MWTPCEADPAMSVAADESVPPVTLLSEIAVPDVVPVAVSAFPDELTQAPRSWAEQAYPNLIHYNKLPKGGHFAAWEQPQLFTEEVRTAFRTVRPSLPAPQVTASRPFTYQTLVEVR